MEMLTVWVAASAIYILTAMATYFVVCWFEIDTPVGADLTALIWPVGIPGTVFVLLIAFGFNRVDRLIEKIKHGHGDA